MAHRNAIELHGRRHPGVWVVHAQSQSSSISRKLAKNTMSIGQLTWGFANMTAAGGELTIMWDKEIASVPFTLGK